MEITSEQIDLLNSFRCERLSDNMLSTQWISQMENERGSQLIRYLQERGEKEDSEGITAFYIIRNAENLPLAFFSLKCGLLFSPSIIDDILDNVDKNQDFIDALDRGRDEGDPDSETLFEWIDSLAIKNNTSTEVMVRKLKLQAVLMKKRALFYKRRYQDDEKTEENKPIYRVHTTFPGIEIVHFCTNSNAKVFWESLEINHPMGEVLFWRFILSRIEEAKKIVGCQYAYLFAADSSEDRTLINY